MKKRILKIASILFIIVLIFSACNKSNVKYGNKRIIGTWLHKTVKYTEVGDSKETKTYTTNDCGYENSTDIEKYTSTVEINGNTIHQVATETNIEDGEEETENTDTTFTKEEYIYELTFKEDGSFIEKGKSSNTYHNYHYAYDYERTGNWVWVDAYKEKQAIKLIYTYEDDYAWSGTSYYSEFITIKSIDKDEFVLSFVYDETLRDEEYELYDEDCNGKVIYRTDIEEETYTVEGTRTLSKK